MNSSCLLIVEHGAPYQNGDYIQLNQPEIILGRKSKDWEPDVSFNNIFVSRKHAKIVFKNHHYYLSDLNSKHGTFLNNIRLNSGEECILKDADKISLSEAFVAVTFSLNVDETSDIKPLLQPLGKFHNCSLDSIKLELKVENEIYSLTEKEFKFIEYLLKREEFVPKEDLKKYVWPERISSTDHTPDVSTDEINSLLYRLRKKIPPNICIENIKGKGFILSFEEL